MTRQWLEMDGLLKRRVTQGLWVPLYRSKHVKSGEYGHIGYRDDYEGIRTLAISNDKIDKVKDLEFSSFPYHARPYVENDVYHRADSYVEENDEVGIQLAISSYFDGLERSDYDLNQDLVLGLRLLREGDIWVRPQEGYIEVARIEKDANGFACGLVMRPEHLKDYLSARKMSLLSSMYLERQVVVSDARSYGFDKEEGEFIVDIIESGRRELRSAPIHEGGFGFGHGTAVFQIGRTDHWHKDDLPIMGPETEDNTTSKSWSFTRSGKRLYLLSGEFRRTEWLQPSAVSVRVAGNRQASAIGFIVDAAGEKLPAGTLNHEDIGRWLWFSPGIIPDLKARRGFFIEWYSAETGGIKTPSGFHVHFGLNGSGLVVTYAHDVARLDEWEHRIWAGYNVLPEGGIGDEIHRTQVQGEYADTEAAENVFVHGREAIDAAVKAKWGEKLFCHHERVASVLSQCHRFRSLDERGFLELAKDIARVIADDINLDILHRVSPPPKDGSGKGSLKSLQRALGTIANEDAARDLVGPLVGVYDLRLADAHLPSSKLPAAYTLAQVETEGSWLQKGQQLLAQTGQRLKNIAAVIGQT